MALGSNRDYGTRQKNFMKSAKEKGWIDLWACPKCNRKNLHRYNQCPRCGQIKEEQKND